MSRAKQHYIDGMSNGFDFAVKAAEVYQAQLKKALDEHLFEMMNNDLMGNIEPQNLSEDDWNEVSSAQVFQQNLLTLIAQFKSEGYVAATLDKFAALVIGGYDGFKRGENDESDDV